MYFSIPTNYKKIENNFFGYKLGNYGGNFVEFIDNKVKFSFHKDFKLYKNSEILLTNVPIQGEELPNNIIEFDILTGKYITKNFNQTLEMSYSTVVEIVKDILIENLKTCCKINYPQIVYTAGLDSSTLAYLAFFNGIDFLCLVQDKYKDKFKLPFKNIKYCKLQDYPEFAVNEGRTDNIKSGFYQQENNNLITGYYGDNTILHHKELYFQTKHLCNINVDLYDLSKPTLTNILNSKQDIVNAVLYINTQNYFRQWFNNFQILDPYRDPRLIETVLSLPLPNLIIQFGSAKIQKDIIKSINSEWINDICENKNDYGKFQSNNFL